MYNCATFSPDGNSLAIGCKSGDVFVLDIETNEITKVSYDARHGNRVQCLTWNEKGLYSLGWDDVLFHWDVKTRTAVQTVFVPCANQDAFTIADDVVTVGISELRNNLKVFDLRKYKNELVLNTTLTSAQAHPRLAETDKDCGILTLKQCRFDPSLWTATTFHNNTLQFLKNDGSKFTPLYSFEGLEKPIETMVSSLQKKRLFYGAQKQSGVIDISL